MSAGNCDHIVPAQKFIVQNLRQRLEWDAVIENVLQFRVSTRDRIANDHQAGSRVEILFRERLSNGNVERRKEVRHGRVSRGVRTRHAEPTLFQHAGQRCHGRATNSNQVNVLRLSHPSQTCLVMLTRGCDSLTAASAMLSVTESTAACNSANAPKGSVTFCRRTCPEGKP